MATNRISRAGTPEYRLAALAAALVFALYLLTLAPSVAMWDTGEYMAAVKVLGIPHPPGNPFFMLLGHAFASIPLPLSYAARINALAALASACSAGFWFLMIDRIAARFVDIRWQRLAIAAVGTVLGATAFTVWNQAVVNEKVYPVSLLFLTVVSWLMFLWLDEPVGRRADRLIVLVGFLLGLGYANHPAGFLAGPAFIVAVLMRRPRAFLDWPLVARSLAALLLGLTPFIYEPIRAAHFPPINEGAPTACATEIHVSCTFSGLTAERLKENITRQQYGVKVGRGAPFVAQVGMWWLYFKWQWLRDAHGEHPRWQLFLALLFFILGVTGAYVHWKEDRETFWYLAPLMLTLTLLLIYYLNFKYGWSQDPSARDVEREVRDRDYFYVWSFSAWGVWAGLGVGLVWSRIAATVAGGFAGGLRGTATAMSNAGFRRGLLIASPVLLIALIPVYGNHTYASRAGQTFTEQWARDYLNSLEPYAIVVTNGDNDTFPLWFAQEVEGVRQDVTVAVSTYLQTDWFLRQMIRTPVPEYDAARGPAIFRNKVWKRPSGPPLRMTFAEADSIPELMEIQQPQIFQQGNMRLLIPPGYLSRDELVLLRLIKDALPERPLYVSTGAESGLGLEPYLLNQGFVQKIMPDSIPDTPRTPLISGLRIDLDRTRDLWFQVYRAPDALVREGDWTDRSSSGIPYTYAFTGAVLAEALGRVGDVKDATAVMQKVKQVVKAGRIAGFPVD